MREQLDRGVGIAMMLQLESRQPADRVAVDGGTFPWLNRRVELPLTRLVTEGTTYMLVQMSQANGLLRDIDSQLSPSQRKLAKAAVSLEIASGAWIRRAPVEEQITGSEVLDPLIFAMDVPNLGASAVWFRTRGQAPGGTFYWAASDIERREEMIEELARYNYRSLRAA